MAGVEGKEFLVNNKDDEEEVADVVKKACEMVFGMTGGAGFPLLCARNTTMDGVKRGVERTSARALVYLGESEESCNEEEVEEWLRKMRNKEEERVLIVDDEVSRGWETSHILVVDLDNQAGSENLVMRTVGYCPLVKPASQPISHGKEAPFEY